MRNLLDGVGARSRATSRAPTFRIPHSAFRIVSTVSNCHTGTKCLDCPHKYGAPVPAADFRRSRGADGRADRPGGGGMGARRPDRRAIGGGARGARGGGGGAGREGGAAGAPATPAPRGGGRGR